MANSDNKRKISFFVQNLIVLIVLLLILGFVLIPDLFKTIAQWLG